MQSIVREVPALAFASSPFASIRYVCNLPYHSPGQRMEPDLRTNHPGETYPRLPLLCNVAQVSPASIICKSFPRSTPLREFNLASCRSQTQMLVSLAPVRDANSKWGRTASSHRRPAFPDMKMVVCSPKPGWSTLAVNAGTTQPVSGSYQRNVYALSYFTCGTTGQTPVTCFSACWGCLFCVTIEVRRSGHPTFVVIN